MRSSVAVKRYVQMLKEKEKENNKNKLQQQKTKTS